MARSVSAPSRLVGALILVLALASAAGARGSAMPAGACPLKFAYTMTAGALTGQADTDLTLHLTAASGCAAVTTVKSLVVTQPSTSGKIAVVGSLQDVAAPDGVVQVPVARVDRGARIDVLAVVQTGSPPRMYQVHGDTTSLLRPDLVVSAVNAPLQTLTTRPVDVTAEISEVNGDVGATAQVTLTGDLGPLADPQSVTVPAGGRVTLTFPGVALTNPVPTELKVLVGGVAPNEYDATNNDRSATVDVTKDELARSRLLVQSLDGYGFQFNHHLYAPITNPPPQTLPDLESKVKALEPQLVRIFFSENWEENSDGTHPEWQQNLDSFRNVVQLAQDSGAEIVIAYQGVASAKLNPTLWMSRFADVLQDLVQNRGDTNVRWVSIGNEPNSGAMTVVQYEALVRAIDAQLVARGLRSQISIMGGDLVQNTEGTPGGHRAWFDYMTAHMNDVIDGWSEHIYWNYFDTRRMEERLKDVAYLVHQQLPADAQKPTFIMEYGVRGVTSCGTKPDLKYAYYQDANCTDLRRMPLAAFQRLWFAINSAQLGFVGASNWDLYWATYDRTKANQSFWAIGPPEEGWALYPTYYAFQLVFRTTAPGWQVIGVDPWTADDQAEPIALEGTPDWKWDTPEQELTAYAGPDGQLTVLGLDTNGGQLTAPNGVSSSYSIGGLPPYTTFTLAVWNGTGDGTNSVAGTITTTAAGVARFDVPLQAAFALTTVPVS